jgi:hypothetical protein
LSTNGSERRSLAASPSCLGWIFDPWFSTQRPVVLTDAPDVGNVSVLTWWGNYGLLH